MPDDTTTLTPNVPNSPEALAMQAQPPPEMREQQMMPAQTTLTPPPSQPPPQLPPRPIGASVANQPVSKAEFFRDMLGKFFYSVGTGLANRGSGPDADIRGAGAAITALPNLALQQEQLARVPVTVNGQTMLLPATAAKQILAAQVAGQSRENVAGTAATSRENVAATNVAGRTATANITAANKLDVEKMKVMVQAGQISKVIPVTGPDGKPAMEAINKFGKSMGILDGALPPSSYLPKSTSTIDYKQLDDGSIVALPKISTSGPILPGGGTAKPGAGVGVPVTVKDAQGNPLQGKGAVTSTTRTMVETAPKVLDLVGRLKGQIDDLEKSGALGPGMSRWNEFWSGKVGTENQQFRAMMTNATLLSTLLMRMHMGARGSTQIMEHFDNMIGAGHQSAANMKAALDQLEIYANDVKGAAPLPANYGKSNQGGAGKTYSSDNPFAKKP